MENLVAGYFHGVRAAAKKARRDPEADDRFIQRQAERQRLDQERRMRVDVQDLRAAIERAWWDYRIARESRIMDRRAERDAYERSQE